MKLSQLTPRVIRFGTSMPDRVKFSTEAERIEAKRQRAREWRRDMRAKCGRTK